MPDFASGSDSAMTPDAIEFDPFEMDWPWPRARVEQGADAGQPAEPSMSPPAHPAPRLP